MLCHSFNTHGKRKLMIRSSLTAPYRASQAQIRSTRSPAFRRGSLTTRTSTCTQLHQNWHTSRRALNIRHYADKANRHTLPGIRHAGKLASFIGLHRNLQHKANGAVGSLPSPLPRPSAPGHTRNSIAEMLIAIAWERLVEFCRYDRE